MNHIKDAQGAASEDTILYVVVAEGRATRDTLGIFTDRDVAVRCRDAAQFAGDGYHHYVINDVVANQPTPGDHRFSLDYPDRADQDFADMLKRSEVV